MLRVEFLAGDEQLFPQCGGRLQQVAARRIAKVPELAAAIKVRFRSQAVRGVGPGERIGPQAVNEDHGDLAGLVGLHHHQLRLDVGLAGIEKAVHVLFRRRLFQVNQRCAEIAVEGQPAGADRTRIEHERIVELQDHPARRRPQDGSHGKRLPLAEELLFAGRLPHGDQRCAEAWRVVIMQQIVVIEIGGRQDLAEVAGLPGKAVIRDGHDLATFRGGDRQVAAGIEAAVAVCRGKHPCQALLIGRQGGLLAPLKLLPGQDCRLAIEGDALRLMSRLGSLGRRQRGPRRRRGFIRNDRPQGRVRCPIGWQVLPAWQRASVAAGQEDCTGYGDSQSMRSGATCRIYVRDFVSGPVHDPTSRAWCLLPREVYHIPDRSRVTKVPLGGYPKSRRAR